MDWKDDAAARKSLNDVYDYAQKTAQVAGSWYMTSKNRKQGAAKALRFAAIILTALGGIVPFLVAGKYFGQNSTDLSQAGYIALALAATCIAVDKFFGYSSGWIRYITTGMVLQRIMAEFQMDWAVLQSGLPNAGEVPQTQRELLLRRVQAFVLRIRDEIEKETAEWAVEYRGNLAELEKSARDQLTAWKPGVINLTIPNAALFKDGVTVSLDGNAYQTVSTTCQITPVYPGSHVVQASGTFLADGKAATASAASDVTAGQTVALTLTPV